MTPIGKDFLDKKIAQDPPTSQKQRAAMWAAASGHSTLGIPENVGKEFANADPGGSLPKKAKDMEGSDWKGLIRGLLKFFAEEAQEPEHREGEDEVPAAGSVPNSGLPAMVHKEKEEGEDDAEPSSHAAHVAFVCPDGKTLFLKRGQDEQNYPGYWSLPGGMGEDGETPEQCATRECKEEIGDCSFDGMRPLARKMVGDGLAHTTFTVPVKEPFHPWLNGEHEGFVWAHPDQHPEPLHPGVKQTMDESFGKLENSLAHKKGVHNPKALAAYIGREHGKIKDDAKHAHDANPQYRWRSVSQRRPLAKPVLAMDWSGRCALEGFTPSRPVLAFDRDSVRDYDVDGRLHVADANICKAQVSKYLGSEIPDGDKMGLDPNKEYRLWRHPDELAKAADSFKQLPILSKHVPVDADTHPPELVVGSTGSDSRWEDPFIKSSLVFWPKRAINEIETNEKRELSPGYRYKADMTSGVTPDGEAYDGIMRDVIGNHLAQVQMGRQGKDVVVGDSARRILRRPYFSVSKASTAN